MADDFYIGPYGQQNFQEYTRKMIKPEDARSLSLQGIETKFKDDLVQIFDLIKTNASNGRFAINYKTNICSLMSLKILLNRYGYHVDINTTDSSLNIYWG